MHSATPLLLSGSQLAFDLLHRCQQQRYLMTIAFSLFGKRYNPRGAVTHILYSAWFNTANWSEMVEPNVTMLRNLVSNIEAVAPLDNVSLIQGYKVYGVHLGPFK